MPVWHERTKALRAAGRLQVVGIAQEQHADRCLLFARWQGLDWPILWDPFNVTGTTTVPRVTLIDEHGIVRATHANIATFEEDFVGRTFAQPAGTAAAAPAARPGMLVEADRAPAGSAARRYHEALSALLWPAGRDGETAMHHLQAHAAAHPQDAAAQWRLGVAYRMRYDSLERSMGDFQHAIDQWRKGLDLDPSHYIYRRRLEQYGPRLAKPYPFYPWIAEARRALGAKAPPLVAEPTRSELAGRAASPVVTTEPDTRGADEGLQDTLRLEPTVVWHTDRTGRTAARVHLQVRPAGNRVLLWDADAGPVILWIELPEGFETTTHRHDRRLTGKDRAEEVVEFDFEVRPPSGAGTAFTLEGYVLYHACLDLDGTCKLLKQAFRLPIPAPGR